MRDQRRGLGVIDLQPPPDGRLAVVVALDQARAVLVADAFVLGRVEFDPPKHEGVCDQDGARLIQRDDDREETIRKRLSVYHKQTEPLIGYYEERGLLRRLDGTRPPQEVHAHIRATLATVRLEESL